VSTLAMDLGSAWQEHPQNTNKRRAASAEEYVFLDLLRTCDLLSRGLAEVLKTEDLPQHNTMSSASCAERRKGFFVGTLPAE